LLGPVGERQTYRNLLYLLVRFPLGVAYFTLLFTLLTVGVVLTPLLVGIPLLAATVAGVGYLGAFEARLARTLLDVDVAFTPADPRTTPLVPFLKRGLRTPHNYALLIAAFAAFPIGMLAFILLTLGLSLSGLLVLAPVLYPVPGVTYGISGIGIGGGTSYAVTSLPEALALCVVGVLVAIAFVHMINLAATLLGRLTVALLHERGRSR
jgi:hypothetical protein